MEVSQKHETINEYLDSLETESRQATRDREKDWESYVDFYRGQHWQQKLPQHRIPFTSNHVNVSIKRLVGMMTDTKPTIDVHSPVESLTDLTQKVLVPALRANWDEQGYDQKLAGGVLPTAIKLGACAVNVGFDPTIGSMGDICLDAIDPRSLILDPAITRTVDVDCAEYSGYQTIMSLSRIRQMFPRDGHLVEADSTISPFLNQIGTAGSGAFSSPAHMVFRRFNKSTNGLDSTAIPRARLQVFHVNDRRKIEELPKDVQEDFLARGKTLKDYAWPGGRRFVRAGTNKVMLYDGPNPFIDQKTPIVMFDWGLETENVWGESEVKLIKSLQAILNKLGSSIVENAVKMNNNIWIGDRDALEKHEWDRLTDAPGLLVKLKPSRVLRRESAPALPGSIFQMMQWIVNEMDTLTGLVEANQGKRPVGIVSGSAIEALQLSSQTLIRLQTRKYENFLERIGQRLISRIFQYYSSDRLMHSLGPRDQWQEFQFERKKLTEHKIKMPDETGKFTDRKFDYHQDLDLLQFRITPGSSMAITRIQKAQMAMGLYQAHLIPGEQVLQILEWENPEDSVQRARSAAAAGMTQLGDPKRGRVAA